jgi:hypothetical protein
MNKLQRSERQSWILNLCAEGCPTLRVSVGDSQVASLVFARYRDSFGLVASDMGRDCGNVYDSTGSLIARISYNGRVWNQRGKLMHEASIERNNWAGDTCEDGMQDE